jgi:hypothetical protein
MAFLFGIGRSLCRPFFKSKGLLQKIKIYWIMKSEDKKKLPVNLLKEWANIITSMMNAFQNNSDIIRYIPDDALVIYFTDRDAIYDFKVYNPVLGADGKGQAIITYAPMNKNNIKVVENKSYTLTDIKKQFLAWIEIIREYEEITFSDEDRIEKQYEEEYFTEFDIVDEDADVKPYNEKSQEEFYKLLTWVQDNLRNQEPNNGGVEIIIADIDTLKDNLSRLTKRKVIRSWAKICSKIKILGVKFWKGLLDAAKKEAYKQIISGSIHIADDIWKHLT